MIYFYESEEDLAIRGQACLSADNLFDSVENTTGMDIVDFIEATYIDQDSNDESEELDERREDRYEQMASRYGC